MAWSGSVNVLQRKHEFRPGKRSKDLSKRHPVYPAGKTETETEELLMGVEKKRRLNVDQVNYLEASFSADLKLEPERKALLAKHLGICPRQVAIWFQNRRARWKTQQLEQDYESLKTRYDSVLKEKDRLLKEFDSAKDANKRLQAEVASLISSLQSTEKSDTMETREDQPCSGKSEVMSTSKSGNDQSEMQDSGQSYQTVPETGAFVTRTPHMEQPRSVCSAEIEPEVPILPSTNCNNGCVPLLVQHIIPKGYCPDSAYNVYYEWDNHFSGWGPL